jgi:hypothetical protein
MMTNSFSTGAKLGGSMMMAPYMPLPIWCKAGASATMVHVGSSVFGFEFIDQGFTGFDSAHALVPGDFARMEVNRMPHFAFVGQCKFKRITDIAMKNRARTRYCQTSTSAV